MIRVLLADDSPSVRAVLRRFLKRDPEIEVLEAENGRQAVEAVLAGSPHVVLMDLDMPVLDGFAAIDEILALQPTPVVILSSRANRNQVETAFEALRRGVVEVLPKPEDAESWRQLAHDLPQTLRAATQARTPRQSPGAPVPSRAASPASSPALRVARPAAPRLSGPRAAAPAVPPHPLRAQGPLRWVAIGASTGGPAALRELLEALPARVPAGFAIVQHIAAGFELGFADWLNRELPLDVGLAQDGEVLKPGTVRIAPGGAHLLLEAGGVLRLDSETPARRGHRPAADELFASCARSCPREAAAVLMTGMGVDGVEGLLALRAAGGTTLVQDEASSVVFGMPKAALDRGAAELALPPRELARALARLWSGGGR